MQNLRSEKEKIIRSLQEKLSDLQKVNLLFSFKFEKSNDYISYKKKHTQSKEQDIQLLKNAKEENEMKINSLLSEKEDSEVL